MLGILQIKELERKLKEHEQNYRYSKYSRIFFMFKIVQSLTIIGAGAELQVLGLLHQQNNNRLSY
jgi:hypothetical protein